MTNLSHGTMRFTRGLAMIACFLLVSGQLFSAEQQSIVSDRQTRIPPQSADVPDAAAPDTMEKALQDLDLAVSNDMSEERHLNSPPGVAVQAPNKNHGTSSLSQSAGAASGWNRIVSLPNAQVDYWQRYFLSGGEPRLLSAIARLGNRCLSAEEILEQAGLPKTLIAVAFVESGFDPTAVSPKGAKGPWQFMPATAARYGLEQGPWSDDRTNFERSTYAAARYLADLHQFFGDWPLTLAAYNAGEAKVREAISKGKTRNFWLLSDMGLLPQETQEYVPEVLGAAGAWRETLRVADGDSSSEGALRESRANENWVYAEVGGN